MGYVARPEYRPMTMKAISRAFGVDANDYPDFRKSVKRLVKHGKLEVRKRQDPRIGQVAAQQAGKGGHAVIGTFRRTSKGFGFVRPIGATDKSEHIFIPTKHTGDASTGDEVAVKVVRRNRGPGMNDEGRIVEVVERASGVFVGTYVEEGGAGARPGRQSRPSMTRSTSATPAPRAPGPATRSSSRWSASRRPT